MFDLNFYPKPNIDLKDTDISQETRQELQPLQQNHDEIVSENTKKSDLQHWKRLQLTHTQICPLSQANHINL